jgi:hypothetical protein
MHKMYSVSYFFAGMVEWVKQCLKKLCIEGDKTRGMLMCKVGMLNRPATERRKNIICHHHDYC